MTADERISRRLAELTARREAIPTPGNRPLSMTQDEAAALDNELLNLERQIAFIRRATAAQEALGSAEVDERWVEQLTGWRSALCGELLTIRSPIRDPVTMGTSRNLTLSIKCIDFGLRVFKDSGWELANSKLGQLMREAGYEQTGADPSRNYSGELPWFGSLPEVEKRLTMLAAQRADAKTALDEALMSDEERAAREAENKAYRDAYNSMNVKNSADPTKPGLRVVDDFNEDIDETTLTPMQQKALERARRAFATV